MNNRSIDNLRAEYSDLIYSKNKITNDIGKVLEHFIYKETPQLKKRILSVYEQVAPSKLAELYRTLSNITYGPIKVPNVSLTDNDYTYNGTLICYKYEYLDNMHILHDNNILAFMYCDINGNKSVKYYMRNELRQFNNGDERIRNIKCDTIPKKWYDKVIAISESEAGPLIEFLKRDFDLGELGDKHCAIPDYYDVELKLRTGQEYFWKLRQKESDDRRARLQAELHSSIEMYENRTGIDIQQHEWEHVQSLLQKALVELQVMM